MPPSNVASLLKKAGIEAKRRAETLSLEEWRELWEVFAPFSYHPELFPPGHPERSEESSPAQDRLREGSKDSSVATLPQNDIRGE
jgi:hypothetical protein